MTEYELNFRAKSDEAARRLRLIAAQFPADYEILGSKMLPDIQVEIPKKEPVLAPQDSGLFKSAKEFLDLNPGITARNLMHHSSKEWQEQLRDLAALVVLSERAIAKKDRVALLGIQKLHGNTVAFGEAQLKRGIQNKAVGMTREMFSASMFTFFRNSIDSFTDEETATRIKTGSESGVTRVTPSEIRIVALVRGLTGEVIDRHEIGISEGLRSIDGRRTSCEAQLRRSIS